MESKFNTPGEYEYGCEPHAGAGMAGRVSYRQLLLDCVTIIALHISVLDVSLIVAPIDCSNNFVIIYHLFGQTGTYLVILRYC